MRARALLEESITVFRHVGEKQGLVRALLWHGGITFHQGDFKTARASADECIRLGREVGDVSNIAAAIGAILAYIAFLQGDDAAAQSLQEESLRLMREVDDRPGIAHALGNLGSLAYLQGQYEQAKPFLQERLQIWRELGSQHYIAWSLHTLGYVALRQNDRQYAAALFAESLALWREQGETQGIARCLAGLAEVAQARGQLERAAQLLAATQVLLEASGRQLEDTDQDPAAGYPIISQAEFDRHVAAVRAALGDEAFETAWAAGQAMPLEQAIAEALHARLAVQRAQIATEAPDQAPESARTVPDRLGTLTLRERQVLALIAQGASNRAIADALVIAERTAEIHVSNILGKLGVTSRTQAAAYAVAQGLAAPPDA